MFEKTLLDGNCRRKPQAACHHRDSHSSAGTLRISTKGECTMNPRKTLITGLLVLCLTLSPIGCAKKPATTANPPAATLSKGDQIIHDAKVYGPVVAAALDEGIKQEALFAQSGDIPPSIEPGIRQGLLDARKVVSAFNDKAATWTH